MSEWQGMVRSDGVRVLPDREMPKRPYFVVDSAWQPMSVTTRRGWFRVLRYSTLQAAQAAADKCWPAAHRP